MTSQGYLEAKRMLEAAAHSNGNGKAHSNGTASLEENPDALRQNDLGNGRRLAFLHGKDLHYCGPWGRWLVWDKRRWVLDDTLEAERRAKDTVRQMLIESAGLGEGRKDALKWAEQSGEQKRLTAMLNVARSEPGIPVVPDDLNRKPMLFNVQNGTLDLATGDLLTHERRDLLTVAAPVKYDPDAACPQWMEFLAYVMDGDEDLIGFLQRAIGYSLTGSVAEQCLFFLYGSGQNGKSTLLGAVLEMLGGYGKKAAPDLLMAKEHQAHPTELADLFGARFVYTPEVDRGKRLAESMVKDLTGGDRISARFMRKDFFEFDPTFKIFLAANHKPVIRGTDFAIWRRIHMIPFTVQIPEDRKDPHLRDKLRAELPGILRWAVEGCLSWQKDGLGVPQRVKDATAGYRTEMDAIGQFIGERCVVDPQAYVAAGDRGLYEAYEAWCRDGGDSPMSKTGFGKRLGERGFERGKNAGKRVWIGLRLTNASDLPTEGNDSPWTRWTRFPYEQPIHAYRGGDTENASNASNASISSSPDDPQTGLWDPF